MRFSICAVGLLAFWTSSLAWSSNHASEVAVEVLGYPRQVSKFTEFYARVRITNNGKVPLGGCSGRLVENCLALGWDFMDGGTVISLPRGNVIPVLPYPGPYLYPGETMEKSIEIPIKVKSRAPVGRRLVLRFYVIVGEESGFILKEKRLEMVVSEAPASLKIRRVMIRTMVYGYLSLSVILLSFGVFLILNGRISRSR